MSDLETSAPRSHVPAARPMNTVLRECLAFRLRAEEYGIDILRVQEVRGYEPPPTQIANVVALTGEKNSHVVWSPKNE